MGRPNLTGAKRQSRAGRGSLFLYACGPPPAGAPYGLGARLSPRPPRLPRPTHLSLITHTHSADAPLPEDAATAAAADAAPLLFEARLRAEGDRAAVRRALLAAWGGGGGSESIRTGYTSRRPALAIAAGGVLRLGLGGSLAAAPASGEGGGEGCSSWDAFSSRARRASAPGGRACGSLGLLPSQMAALEAVATGLARGRLALLAGPAGSGKTSLARAAAAAAGARLVELSLSPASDTADLLGGYEQVEPARALARAVDGAGQAAAAAARAAIVAVAAKSGAAGGAAALAPALASVGAARAAAAAADVVSAAAHGRDDGAHATARAAAAGALIAAARAAVEVGKEVGGGGGEAAALDAASALADAAAAALATAQAASAAASANPSASAGRFEWLDGALTRAAAAGHWVLLDGAGRAPPAVLDRLNPLLEPGGLLALHEAGGGGGGQRVVTPHPAFRLLLAVDPGRGGGEVSRAMRNRGVEVWVGGVGGVGDEGGQGGAAWWPAAAGAASLASAAVAEGVPPGGPLVGALAGAAPAPATLRRWARSAAALVDRGWAPGAALSAAWRDTAGCGDTPPPSDALAAAASASLLPLCRPGGGWRTGGGGASAAPAPWAGAAPGGSPAGRDVSLFAAAASPAVAAALAVAASSGADVRGAVLARPSLVAWCPAALLAGVGAEVASPSPPSLDPAAVARAAAGLVLERACPGGDASERGARLRWLASWAADGLGDCAPGAVAVLAGPGAACDSPLLAAAAAGLASARAALAATLPPAAWSAATSPFGSTPLDVAAVPLLASAAAAAGPAASAAWAAVAAASARAAAAREAALDWAALAAGPLGPTPPGCLPSALQASAAAGRGGRARVPAGGAHAAVPWLSPALAAIAAVETAALSVEGVGAWLGGVTPGQILDADGGNDESIFDCTPRTGAAPLPAALAALRSWRRSFVRAVARPPAPALCVETTAAAWLGLVAASDAVMAAASAACAADNNAPATLTALQEAAARVAHAATGLGPGLGLPPTPPPPPLLWAGCGHPLAPRSPALAAARAALTALAAAADAGGAVIGCAAGPVDGLAAADAAAAAAAALGAAGLLDPSAPPPDPASASAAAAALAVDPAWRAALADGWALVTAASCAAGAGAGEAAAAVPADLAARARSLAARAASGVGADPAIGPAAAAVDGGDASVLLLPASLMADPACRALQAGLGGGVGLAAAGAALPLLAAATAAAAGRLAGGGVGHVPAPPPPAALRAAALLAAAAGGGTDARLAGTLVSLADAVAAGGLSSTASTAPARAASAALAEAWQAWHAGLWTGGPGTAGAWLAGAPAVAAAFNLTSTAARRTAARRAGARGLALRLAARAAGAGAVTAAVPPPRRAAAASTWRALGALLGHALAAHVPAAGPGALSLGALAAECVAAGERAAVASASVAPPRRQPGTSTISGAWSSDDEEEGEGEGEGAGGGRARLPLLDPSLHALAASVAAACAASSHAGLADPDTWGLLVGVAACLSAAAGGGATSPPPDPLSPAGTALRGRAWALLGAARLALGAPAGATDPAGAAARRRDRATAELEDVTRPGLAARRAAQLAPGGPDEGPALAALAAAAAALEAGAATADADAVARPTPPAYAAVRALTLAFTSGVGSPARAAAAVDALWAGAPGAAATAAAWGEAAAAWSARASRDHPAYADVLGPALLGAAEARVGLALLCSAAAAAAAPPEPALAVASLAAWPPRLGGPATAAAAGAAAARAASARGASGPAAAAAGAAARVVAAAHTLRVAARAAAGPGGGVPRSDASAVAAPAMRALLAEWEAARDAADAAAEAEGVLFKQAKSRLAASAAEEDDDADEAAFRAAHPDHAAAWADLAPEGDGMDEDGPAAQPPPPPPPTTPAVDPDSGTAGLALTGPTLAAIVADHASLFLHEAKESGPTTGQDAAHFAATFDTAASLVSDASSLPPAMDDDDRLAAGRLLRLALEHGAGSVVPGVAAPATPATGGKKKKGSSSSATPTLSSTRPPLPTITDMEAPAPAEAALLLPATIALRVRVGELLAEWPDNPVLARIDAVAARLLDLPATAPLRSASVGLDLLLSAAQLWQETAASHVRLDAALAPLSALATRWRGAELAGWRATLERVQADAAAGKGEGGERERGDRGWRESRAPRTHPKPGPFFPSFVWGGEVSAKGGPPLLWRRGQMGPEQKTLEGKTGRGRAISAGPRHPNSPDTPIDGRRSLSFFCATLLRTTPPR